jgi:hypothetical protein
MLIEGAQVFAKDLAVTAASVNSGIVDLGKNGDMYTMPWVEVNLTAPFTTGSLTGVKVQTADNEAFATPVDVQSLTVPTTVSQTAPAILLQFRLPFGMKRWARLVFIASAPAESTPAGGRVFAGVTTGVPLP